MKYDVINLEAESVGSIDLADSVFGVDVRKEVKLKHKDFRWVALAILIIALIAVIITGILLIFKVI